MNARSGIATILCAALVVAVASPALAVPCEDPDDGECIAVGAGASSAGGPGTSIVGEGTFTASEGAAGDPWIRFEFECRARSLGPAVTTQVEECVLLTSDDDGRPVTLAAPPVSSAGATASTTGRGEGSYCGYWLLASGYGACWAQRHPTLCWKVGATFPSGLSSTTSGCTRAIGH